MLRVDHLHVDAVGDAGKIAAAALQHAVEPVGVVRIPQLLRIGLGDGRDAVGHDDGGFHEVRAVVKPQDLVAACAEAQHVIVELQVALALILDVMDGEDAFRLREAAVVLGLEQQRDESSLPVMAADHVGPELEIVHGREHGLAEVGVALAVVGKTVDAAAVEVVFVVNKIDLQLFPAGLQPENADILAPPGQRHIERAQKLHRPFLGILDLAVIRKKQADIGIFLLRKCKRERLHHVAEAAGLDERRGLRGNNCDFHTVSPLSTTSGWSFEPSSLVPGRMVTFLSRMQ